MLKHGWVLLVCAAAACGDNSSDRKLEIIEPLVMVGSVKQLCAGDDQSNLLEGVQIDVTVRATGFAEGDMVQLSLDGGAPSGVGQRVTAGQAMFTNFTVPEGVHSLVARSEDGEVLSAPVTLNVDTDPPAVSFTAPVGGATIQMADDVAPAPGIQIDVQVDAAVEDGQNVKVTLTSPTGSVIDDIPAVAAAGGHATIRVTFDEDGPWKVRADTSTQCGNPGFAVIDIGVGSPPPVPCTLEITPAPITRPRITNPVLNFALDPDKTAPKFQATVKARSTPGNTADLFVNLTQVGTRTAVGLDGTATFEVDLDDGDLLIQAQCRDRSNNVSDPPASSRVFVDTVAPVCAITAPSDDQTIIPADDILPATPETDFNVSATITGTPIQPSGSDTDGELAQFEVDAAAQTATVAANAASVVGSLAAPKTLIPIEVTAQDRAGNVCTAAITVDYETEGCPIALLSPTATVTTDGGAAPGVQGTITYQLGPACAGRTVTLTGCDISGTPLTVTATTGTMPTATFSDVTLCALQTCPLSSRTCHAEVQNPAGITTSVTSTISVDTQPPELLLTTFQPPNRCGGSVTAADDVDANPGNGVQIRVRVSGVAVSKWVETTPPQTPNPQLPLEGGAFANVTLTLGQNEIVARGTDESGLTGTSPPCTVALSTLALAITQPTNGAILGSANGTVEGQTLVIQVCGTVGEPTTSTVTVRVDDEPTSQVTAAVQPDGTWCAAGVVVPAGTHSIDAAATSTGGGMGTASVSVTVDLDTPTVPMGFAVAPMRRNTVLASWMAPDNGAGGPVAYCEVRQSNFPIPDAGAWIPLPAGTVVPSAPPGSLQSTQVSPLKTGRPWFFGVRCFDAAGNGSPVATNAAPLTLAFTSSAVLTPAAVDDYRIDFAQMGASMTGADLNGDGFNDLVVGAPNACRPAASCDQNSLGQGLVYVYMGGAGGVAATASFAIRGTDAGTVELFGWSMATLDWNHDGIDDVAIGAPFGGGVAGSVFIFFGEDGPGGKWTPGAQLLRLNDNDADVTIEWTAGGVLAFGFRIEALDFDGDGNDDLAITAPSSASASGTLIVLHGPPAGTPILAGINIPADLGIGPGKAGTTAVAFQFAGGREMGTTLGALGRASTDSRDDVAVGPSDLDDASFTPEVDVIHGRAQQATPFTTLTAAVEVQERIVGPRTADQSAYAEQIGSFDIDGDGRRDPLVTDSQYSFGSVFGVRSTAPPPAVSVLPDAATFLLVGPISTARLGTGLANNAAGLGSDVDGDGDEDVVMVGAGTRSVYVWYGNDPPLTATLDDTVVGPPEFVGSSGVRWIGDTNNDGLADLAWADARLEFFNIGPGAVVVLR